MVGLVEGDGGQLEGVALHLGNVRLHVANFVGAESLFSSRGGFLGTLAQSFNLLRDGIDRGFEALFGKLLHELLRRGGGDEVDLRLGGAIGVVALRVVPVEMRINHVADGFGV